MFRQFSFSSQLCLFFVGHAQSAFGNYMGYVALIILANQRFHDPTKLSLLILAEFIPVILFGPAIGHFVDTHSKRYSAIASDGLRALAFVGLAVFASFPLMMFLALSAGFGAALYYTAVQSGLPNMAKGRRLHKILSWQSAITSLASVGGPFLAGILLAFWNPRLLLILNAITFGLSALIIRFLPLDNPKAKQQAGPPELSQLAALRRVSKLPARFKVLLATTGGVALLAGMIGIAEVYFALNDLQLGQSGLGILLGAYGIGMVLGNLSAMHAKVTRRPEDGYLLGLLLICVGLIACSLLRQPLLSVIAYSIAGIGNGFIVVGARVLISSSVKPARQGLAYGARDGAECTGLVISLIAGAQLVTLWGARTVVLLAGLGAGVTFIGGWIGFQKVTSRLKPSPTN